MTKQDPATAKNIPDPVEGKTVFQINANIRIRFNSDGWVEEISKGGADDPLGTTLQGRSGSRLDDVCARRYYDLFTRAIVLDIYPRRAERHSGATGLVLFKDLEQDSPLYQRVRKIIEIGNHHFNLGLKPLD